MNNKQPSSAAVGVKIHADLYSTLEGLQEKFSEELGLDLSLSQTIAAVVHDARIDVDPSLNGQRVRVIVLSTGVETPLLNAAQPTALRERLAALQSRFVSPPYPGSEVVDQRRESDR